MLTIGSLFSGVGGLELGLEWAGFGPTLWQVECDSKARAVLARHWPDAERYEDVRAVGASDLAPVGLICGGFPCQDLSAAGQRIGLDGARSGLWYEFARIVGELLPRWVVIENVASGAVNWVDSIRRDLERLGYDSLPIPLTASDVGAWHRRARVFVVAYRDGEESNARGQGRQVDSARAGNAADSDDRQQQHEVERTVADSHSDKQTQRRWVCDVSRLWPRWDPWAAEPDVARVVYGLPGRVDRERQLGNSVVPQCAEVVGWVIRHLEGEAHE